MMEAIYESLTQPDTVPGGKCQGKGLEYEFQHFIDPEDERQND
jgi:hypothetical protein